MKYTAEEIHFELQNRHMAKSGVGRWISRGDTLPGQEVFYERREDGMVYVVHKDDPRFLIVDGCRDTAITTTQITLSKWDAIKAFFGFEVCLTVYQAFADYVKVDRTSDKVRMIPAKWYMKLRGWDVPYTMEVRDD